MSLEAGQASVEGLQPGDAVRDVGAAIPDEPRELASRIRAVPRMAPARDPAGVAERNVESPQVDQQTEVLGVRFAELVGALE